MQPRIVVGDVVVSRPVAADKLAPGQVVLADNPDRKGQLRLHRFMRVDSHGDLVLRGDANRHDDSTPIKKSAVRGVAALRVPLIGHPFLWAQEGRYGLLVVTAAAIALLIRIATWWRPVGDADDTDDTEPRDGQHGRHRSGERAGRAGRSFVRCTVAGHRAGVAARITAVVTSLIAVATMLAPSAEASVFSGTTANPSDTWGAAQYTNCASATAAAGAAIDYPLWETGGSTANDISGNGLNGTYASGSLTSGPCGNDGGHGISFNGSTGYVYGNNAINGSALSQYSYSVWFKTTTGGTLMAFSTAQTGSSGSTDRIMYLTDGGELIFEQCPSGCYSIGTSLSTNYADGNWHFAVVTLGTSSSSYPGMRVYVDNALVAYRTDITTGPTANGYLRVGYVNLTGTPSTPADHYITGSLAFAALYQRPLAPSDIATLYGSAASGMQKFEAEQWAVTANTAPYAVQGNGTYTWSGTGQLWFQSTSSGQYLTASIYVPTAGTYDVSFAQTLGPDYGINTIAVDGTTLGPSEDAYDQHVEYSPPLSYGRLTLSAGVHSIKLTVTGKNSASTNYYAGIDYLRLDPVGGPIKLEGESLLPATSSTAPAIAQGNGCCPTWSNGNQVWFQSTSTGANFAVNFTVPSTQKYALSMVQTMASDYGRNTVAIDGTAVGSTFDAYSSSLKLSPLNNYGQVSLSAGQHSLKLTVTGKNASSSNYYAGVDYIYLVPIS